MVTQTVEVQSVGKMGIITDLLAFELPPNEITSAYNCRYRDFKIIRSKGFKNMQIDLSSWPNYRLVGISPIITDTRTGLVLALRYLPPTTGATASINDYIFLFYNNTSNVPNVIFTQFTGGGKFNSPYQIQFADIFGAKLINARTTQPLIFDLSNTMARPLEHWGEFATGVTVPFRATILTTFKGFYLALNTEENGIKYPNRIRWSELITYPIETGTDPVWVENALDSLAGYLDIPDEIDTITAAEQLGDRFLIYTQYSTYSLQYTGDNFVFQVQKLFAQRGAAGLNCIVEFENKHFVVNNSQFYIHDGQTIQDTAINKVQNQLIFEIAEGYRNIILYKNLEFNEIWICYSKNDPTSSHLDTAAIWNWKSAQWSFAELPVISYISSGPPFYPYDRETATRTYDNTPLPYTDFIGKTPQVFENKRIGQFTFYTTELLNLVFLGDFGYSKDGLTYESSFGRNYIDLNEIFKGISPIKNIRRLIPDINGDGKIKLRVGWSNSLSESIEWQPDQKEMNLDTKEWKIDIRVTGRYFSYEIIMDTLDTYFEITSFDLEANQVGRR